MLKIMCAQATASLALFSIVAPIGIYAMAAAVLARVAFSLPITLAALKKHVGLRLGDWLARVVPALTCAISGAAIGRAAVIPFDPESELELLVVGSTVSVGTFILLVRLVRPRLLPDMVSLTIGQFRSASTR